MPATPFLKLSRSGWVIVLMVSLSLLLHLWLLFTPQIDLSLPQPSPPHEIKADLVSMIKESAGASTAAPAKSAKTVVPEPAAPAAPEPAAPEPAPEAAGEPGEVKEAAVAEEGAAPDSVPEPEPQPPAPPQPAPPPEPKPPVHLTVIFSLFKGADGIKVGRVTHNWEIRNGRYLISSVGEATGAFAMLTSELVVQNSQGRITAAGLAPESYWEQRGQKPDRTFNAQFDYANGTLSYGRLSSQTTVPLPPGTQDQLSFIYQLGLQAPLEGTVEFAMTTGRKLRSYRCEVKGEERIGSAMGELRALHIAKVRKQQKDDAIDIWLAADHQYLPVKVRFTNNDGGVMEMVVESIRSEAETTPAAR